MKIGAIGIRTKIIVGDAATWYLVKKYIDGKLVGGIDDVPEELKKYVRVLDSWVDVTEDLASIENKVDKVEGSSLVPDTEIDKLAEYPEFEDLEFSHENLTDKNSETTFQHVDTTTVKTTLDEADKVALYDSVTGKVVLTPKSNLGGGSADSELSTLIASNGIAEILLDKDRSYSLFTANSDTQIVINQPTKKDLKAASLNIFPRGHMVAFDSYIENAGLLSFDSSKINTVLVGTIGGVDRFVIIKQAPYNNSIQLQSPVVSANAISDSQINFSWSDIDNNTETEIQISTDGINWGSSISLGANTVLYQLTGLSSGQLRYARVRFVGDGIDYTTSEWSEVVSATTTQPIDQDLATSVVWRNFVGATANGGTLTNNGGATNQGAVSTAVAPTTGRIFETEVINRSVSSYTRLGIDAQTVLNTSSINIDYNIFWIEDKLYARTQGGSDTLIAGYTVTNGDKIGMRIESGKLKVYYKRSGLWSAIYTFPAFTAATRYIHCQFSVATIQTMNDVKQGL